MGKSQDLEEAMETCQTKVRTSDITGSVPAILLTDPPLSV